MTGTVMLETGLIEVEVIDTDGDLAMVRDSLGEGYWIALVDLEPSEAAWS